MLTEPIELAENQAALVQRCIAAGRFDNVNEAVRAGLSLLEERIRLEEAKLQELDELLDEAEAGGISPKSLEEVREEINHRFAAGDAWYPANTGGGDPLRRSRARTSVTGTPTST